MNDRHTPPPSAEADELARFAVRDPREIGQLMRALIVRRQLVTAQPERGLPFVTVALALEPGDGTLVLDASRDDVANARAVAGAELYCTTHLDNIRIRFPLHAPAITLFDARPALRGRLPDHVLRMQRRAFYRVATPLASPPTCVVTTAGTDGTPQSVTLRILDIGGGGLAVVVPPQEPRFAPGDAFDDCELLLPDGPLPVRLIVRNVHGFERPNGTRLVRAGCEFATGSPAANARVQRYLFRLESELGLRAAHR